MDDKLKPNLGHVDFGEKGYKKLVAIHRNEDGTVDLETEDGVIYKNCVSNKPYEIPKGFIVESAALEVKNVKIYRENLRLALGLEEQDKVSAKLQEKTIDSVD